MSNDAKLFANPLQDRQKRSHLRENRLCPLEPP